IDERHVKRLAAAFFHARRRRGVADEFTFRPSRAQKIAQRLQEQRLVVDKQNAHRMAHHPPPSSVHCRRSVNTLPSPSLLLAVNSPFKCFANVRTIIRPNPGPPRSRTPDDAPSNTRANWASLMPTPVSRTSNEIASPPSPGMRLTRKSTTPPAVKRTALQSRI